MYVCPSALLLVMRHMTYLECFFVGGYTVGVGQLSWQIMLLQFFRTRRVHVR